jgi:hypothetical protein
LRTRAYCKDSAYEEETKALHAFSGLINRSAVVKD